MGLHPIMRFRQVVSIMCAATALLVGVPVGAQTYPSRTITILNGFPPGGPTDTTVRQIAAKLAERLGQGVVIDNRAGAAGTIAATAAARAEPDGYTLLFGVAANLAVAPALMKSAPYDPAKAFTAIGEVARGPYMWLVTPRVPAANMREFIAWAQKNAGRVNYASPGQGSVHHLATELLKQATGLDMTHIPYKGGATSYTAILGGEVEAMFDGMPSPLPHIRAGKLKALAVTGPKRLPTLPEVPTLAEQGITGVDVQFWWGFVGPAGMPREVVQKLNSEINLVLTGADLKATMAKWDIEVSPGTPEAFGAQIAREAAYWKAFAARSSIKIE